MIKVIHIISRLAYGGAEKLLLDLCRKVDKEKFVVSIIVFERDNPLKAQFEAAGIHVEFFEKKGKFDRGIVEQMATYLKNENPDVVHTHLFAADFWGGQAALRAGVAKIVSTKHDNMSEGCVRNFLGRRMRRQFDRVIAISQATQKFLIKKEKIAENKTVVIYNGIDVNKFMVEDSQILQSDVIRFGCIGRLSREKGFTYLVRAMHFLKNKDWHLTLVGDGQERKELEQMAHVVDDQGRIEFAGMVEDVRPQLAEMDVLVLPSVSEGLGLVILEAALAGKFVIGSNVGGIPEIITDKETGLLFSAKNLEQLVRALDWVNDNREEARKMARKLQKEVFENFNINKIIKEYEAQYESLARK